MNKLIRISSPSNVMMAFIQQWRYDLEGRKECDRLIEKAIELTQNSSSSEEVEIARSWMIVDWFIREHIPAFLELTPSLEEHAKALREVNPIIDSEAYVRAAQELEAIEKEADALIHSTVKGSARRAREDYYMDASDHSAGFAAWGIRFLYKNKQDAKSVNIFAAISFAETIFSEAINSASESDVKQCLTEMTSTLQDSALELLKRMKDIGEHIPASNKLFMNCSSYDAKRTSESEKQAFFERLELDDLVPCNEPTTKKISRL
jgi:hypothetical protein